MDIFNPPVIPNPLTPSDPGSVLASVINSLLVWGAAIAVLFIIIGGFRYIISMGNQEGVEKARNTVLYAVLGLILIFVAYLIVAYLLGSLLGVKPAYQLGT